MPQHLGDFVLVKESFENLHQVLSQFKTESFKHLNEKQKRGQINQALYQLIQESAEPCFLLSAVLDFVDRISQEMFIEHYHFSHFELWLNQFSGLTFKENYHIRSKIIGKRVPREEYQILFPIGMGKSYPGSHFVTAHGSPDIDTTIASFWGWVDAFGARVADGLHLWNVPGGAPGAQVEVEQLFYHPFGKGIFHHLAKTYTSLMVSSMDLLSQSGVSEKKEDTSLLSIDHGNNQNAVILIDQQGTYLGDWRNFDVEGVRQIIELFHLCLRWFENYLYTQMVALFAKPKVTKRDFESLVDSLFGMVIKESQPAKNFTKIQKKQLEAYLKQVLFVPKGMESTFKEFSLAMKDQGLQQFAEFYLFLTSLKDSELFDAAGSLKEERPLLFKKLETVVAGLDSALQSIDRYADRLNISLNIKRQVFGYLPQTVSYRADISEIRAKMGNQPFLTVTYNGSKGEIPLGVVHAQELYKPVLGTVSLRDFCNREETKIPSYLEVISVIDHHKTSMTSMTPPVAHITDSQSSNAIVAELAFAINDRYSNGGMTLEEIKAQIKEVEKDLSSSSNKRIMRRLLQRSMHVENLSSFYVDPKREFLEYLQFVYAILDDTDLLTKISMRDVVCMASLLNRLKSLMLRQEVEIIHFDDIPKDEHFVSQAAKRILQNLDMYSLCRRIYQAKEESVKENLKLCAEGHPSNFFSDTKEQNGCCRVGQAKLYAPNFPFYQEYAKKLRRLWWEQARLVSKEKKDIDFHMQMISTVAGAEDLFAGASKEYSHKDEIWLWVPQTEQAISHLKSFLNAFRELGIIKRIDLEVEFLGDHAKELAQIFNESFLAIPQHISKDEGLPIAVLRFKAGAINSRKAMIAPYLPI